MSSTGSRGTSVKSNMGSPQSASSVISLNIGGHIYSTMLGTLLKYPRSRLAEMFSGQSRPKLDLEGRYFIDRDGTYFKHVLEFLRGHEPPPSLAEEVYQEAMYYGIEPLAKLLEDSPKLFGEMVGRRQFLARVPNYQENIEVMVRVARAEAVACRQSVVMVCVVRNEEDAAKCHEVVNGLDTDKESVVRFGPWKASPSILDLLYCIKLDIESKGYSTSYRPHEIGKGFLMRPCEFLFKFTFTWW
ncbi:BTB/POZ domain-containing protein KCTD14-like isoform X1 [Carcharodon carcharias]|uniref:BTB/POZ domain-containing protein KCTD14-like isoform X1 n=1 Tax=Carcharodon carcharias TaxID=13397 RepID=UPI001B7F2471|nr:BTB/POZ domain-containing protein KCTD14-like isoform X1 [Carcharodon carcharias]